MVQGVWYNDKRSVQKTNSNRFSSDSRFILTTPIFAPHPVLTPSSPNQPTGHQPDTSTMPAPTPTPTYASLAAAAVKSGATSALAALSSLPPPPATNPPLAHAPPGALASFIGMVQDVWDPELFVLRDACGHTALLAEDLPAGACAASGGQATQPVLGERMPVYIVAPPGVSDWAKEGLGLLEKVGGGAGAGGNKRMREGDQAEGDVEMDEVVGEMPSAPKRAAAGGGSSAAAADGGSGRNSGVRHPGMGLNTPLHGNVTTPAVVAKFYDTAAAAALKVHTLVRVTGVVCAANGAPGGENFGSTGDGDGFFADEIAARNPAGVPRLHVLKMEPLDGVGACEEVFGGAAGDVRREGREEVVRYLTAALGGDALAAEYLMMNLVSRVAQRTEAGAVTGKLSVNVVLPKGVDAGELVAALRAVLPAVAHVRVNIPTLNAVDLYPKKDYAANRLRASQLQLPAGCTLIADETGLVDGRLEERGVKNVQALTALSSRAVLPVDFQYYNAELLFDANAVFVSSGGKSIIPVDASIRVAADASGAAALPSCRAASPEALRRMRSALAARADCGEFVIAPAVATAVENTFVEARRAGAVDGADAQETLTRWLAVARAAARTFGEDALTEERWRYAVELEQRRETRNVQVKGAAPRPAATGVAAKPPRAPAPAVGSMQ